jgi:hypothetical protein
MKTSMNILMNILILSLTVLSLEPAAHAQVRVDVSTEFSSIWHASAVTLLPGKMDCVDLYETPLHDSYVAAIEMSDGPLRLLLLDQARMGDPNDRAAILLDRLVQRSGQIHLPPITSPSGVILALSNERIGRPVELQVTIYRTGSRPAAAVEGLKRLIETPVIAVEAFFKVPPLTISVRPCGLAEDRPDGDIIICTELISGLQEHDLAKALNPMLLLELGYLLQLHGVLPGVDAGITPDHFAARVLKYDPESIDALIRWVDLNDPVKRAIVQLASPYQHTISVRRARNLKLLSLLPDDAIPGGTGPPASPGTPLAQAGTIAANRDVQKTFPKY